VALAGANDAHDAKGPQDAHPAPDVHDSLEPFREFRRTRDRALRNALVEQHSDIALSCARRFANRSEPLDDLQQVALLGLLKAVERFDPERGLPFAAFAVPTVLGELRRHFRDRGWMVRIPRRLQELHLRMDGLVSELAHHLGRSPTTSELAAAAGVDEEEVLEAMEVGQCYRPASLDTNASGTDPAAAFGRPDDQLSGVEDRTTLLALLEHLPPREQRIVYMRFFEDRTQSEIAEAIGVSQMHVSRLLARSLADLAKAASTST
jgi:RNA polymerase sigma-B factor